MSQDCRQHPFEGVNGAVPLLVENPPNLIGGSELIVSVLCHCLYAHGRRKVNPDLPSVRWIRSWWTWLACYLAT